MKYFLFLLLFCLGLAACSTKDNYAVENYYSVPEQDSVLASIITYIFTPPQYVDAKDRFNAEHRQYYVGLTPRFSLQKYAIGNEGTNYFLVYRPGPTPQQRRAVGGYFKMGEHFQPKEFREVFVTPLLSDSVLRERGDFLFKEMVNGTVDQYLKMKMYVQWPNELSTYDVSKFEWSSSPDSIGVVN